MTAQFTPNQHELPSNRMQMTVFNGSNHAHELPQKDSLRTFLRTREGQVHKSLCTSAPFIGGAE